MPRFLSIAALLLVAGCGHQDDSSPASHNGAKSAPAAESEKPAVPALNGEWQLAKIRGRPVEPGSAMVASFQGSKVRVTASCNRRAWTFTQNRNIVSFAADPDGSGNCERSTTVGQESAFQAIDRATIAIFDKDGRELTLSGDGGSVALERR